MDEPTLRVGLMPGVERARFSLDGAYDVQIDGRPSGTAPNGVELTVEPAADGVRIVGLEVPLDEPGQLIRLLPQELRDASFLLHGVVVGVQFHWQHAEDLKFRGGFSLRADGERLDVVNDVPLEEYLISVISSEMSARCPPALLRAHAVISRSWLVAQLLSTRTGGRAGSPERERGQGHEREVRIERWYDREDHEHFDVCADDHCQRYQGITRALTPEVEEAVAATRGLVLQHDDEICDARFSKCCGGMTEVFASAWGDQDVPYLQAFHDGPAESLDFALPLADEANATAFIQGAPPAYCNAADADLLARLLPEIDHETSDFYRWELRLDQEELRGLVRDKSGIDPGPVEQLEPLERGPSGRLVKLAIRGKGRTLIVGKELEIRRLLSPTHLYSSAFVIRTDGESGGVPEAFVLRGAGWGHGVGLCQIGAAVMADLGHSHEEILAHYYRGASLQQSY